MLSIIAISIWIFSKNLDIQSINRKFKNFEPIHSNPHPLKIQTIGHKFRNLNSRPPNNILYVEKNVSDKYSGIQRSLKYIFDLKNIKNNSGMSSNIRKNKIYSGFYLNNSNFKKKEIWKNNGSENIYKASECGKNNIKINYLSENGGREKELANQPIKNDSILKNDSMNYILRNKNRHAEKDSNFSDNSENVLKIRKDILSGEFGGVVQKIGYVLTALRKIFRTDEEDEMIYQKYN